MALVVEDGTLVANANTFQARADLIAYAALRGVVIPDTEAADKHLILAMDVLERIDLYPYVGTPLGHLAFPREHLNCDGEEVFPSDEVPLAVKKAQILLAFASQQGTQLQATANAGRQIKRRRVGPMDREYSDNEREVAEVPGVRALLSAYLIGGGGMLLRVTR